jgi:hypothetical protein
MVPIRFEIILLRAFNPASGMTDFSFKVWPLRTFDVQPGIFFSGMDWRSDFGACVTHQMEQTPRASGVPFTQNTTPE